MVTSNIAVNDSDLFVDAVIDRGWVGEEGKNRRKIGGAVSKNEAHTLASLITEHGCTKSFETGVANGISTLAIVQAISRNQGHHYGIDPCQHSDHKGVALTLLNEYGCLSSFTLCEGPAHLELPKLIEADEKFDFGFIDGMHKFDYKFVDFFLADQVLKVGGILVFHDILLPSTKKIHRLIQRSYDYKQLNVSYDSPSFIRKGKYVAAAFLKHKPYWYNWPNGFRNLLVFQKMSEPDRPWDYYRNF